MTLQNAEQERVNHWLAFSLELMLLLLYLTILGVSFEQLCHRRPELLRNAFDL